MAVGIFLPVVILLPAKSARRSLSPSGTMRIPASNATISFRLVFNWRYFSTNEPHQRTRQHRGTDVTRMLASSVSRLSLVPILHV